MKHWIAIPHTVPLSEAGATKLVEYALEEIEDASWMACHSKAVPALRRMASMLGAGLRATDLPELRALLGLVSVAADASGADDIKAAAASLAAYALRPRLATMMPPATPPRRLSQLRDRKGRFHASRLSGPEPWGTGANPVHSLS